MIKNTTQNKIIISKQKIANNFCSRALGLMFSSKNKFNFGLIFDLERETTVGSSLHMFFVFYSINVIFLNKDKEIVDIKENFKPFTLYSTKEKCKYIIELPISITKKHYKLGDKISW